MAIGTMTIGSSLYDNAAFEVNDGYLPEPPSPSEVVAIAERDLDITVRSPVSEQPERFLYLGLLDTCAVYEVEGQEVAVNLQSERAARIADLQMRITTPEQHAMAREEGSKDGGRDSPNMKLLSVPLRYMHDEILRDEVTGELPEDNCGPTSGAMIMAYYQQQRAVDGGQVYPNLPVWPHDHNALYYYMDCNGQHEGVWPEPVGVPGEGWVTTTQVYNYCCFDTSWDPALLSAEWESRIVSHIDDLCPMMVLFLPGTPDDDGVPENHWNALKGYEEDQGSQKYIWTNDPHDIARVLEWDIYYPHIHLTMLWDNPPSIGIKVVEIDKLNILKSWFGKLMDSLVADLPGFQDRG